MKSLNGDAIKKLFISGSNNLYNFYPEIDALNVFPVPDGDTGINMNLTLSSGCKEIKSLEDESAYQIAKTFSRGLLMGARGNSGVITSQIFRGFAEALEGKDEFTVVDFSNALENSVSVAYKAVVHPVEGTILTVIRECSAVLAKSINEIDSFEEAFDILINEANASLIRTPDLLPVLKKAGVVDSGGAGLIKIFEGMKSSLLGNDVERKQINIEENKTNLEYAAADVEGDEFGYCTEFILSLTYENKNPFDKETFTSFLSELGNSLVVVKDEDIVKVHVHTMTPGDVLNCAQQFGEFLKLKIENMTEQHNELKIQSQDSAAVERTKNAIITVSAGKGVDSLFKELGANVIISGGQTMNPSTEDFVNAIRKVNAENIFIFPNNSNIIMAANQAKELNKDIPNIFVIPSKSIPEGIASITMFNDESDGDTNFADMCEALCNVKSGEVTYATRDALVDGVNIIKDDFIGIYNHKLVIDSNNKIDALINLLNVMIDEDEDSVITLLLGSDVTTDEKNKIEDYINKKYPDFDLDLRNGEQPVYSFYVGIE